MSELDEQALEAAGKSLVNVLWDEQMPTADVVARMVVSAYLSAAAARPTPDAEAMEREFKAAMRQYRTATKQQANAEVQATVAVYHGNLAEIEQATERYERELLDLFRKAVSR